VWAVSRTGGISTVNEATEVANSICQIKVMILYMGTDKSLARPTSQCVLFDG